MLGSCRVRGWFDICRACGGSEYFGKRISDEKIGERLGLKDVVLGASLHGVLRRWEHGSGVKVVRGYLHRRR
jgi:hypothetical protein